MNPPSERGCTPHLNGAGQEGRCDANPIRIHGFKRPKPNRTPLGIHIPLPWSLKVAEKILKPVGDLTHPIWTVDKQRCSARPINRSTSFLRLSSFEDLVLTPKGPQHLLRPIRRDR